MLERLRSDKELQRVCGLKAQKTGKPPSYDFFTCRCLNLFVLYGILSKGDDKVLETGRSYKLHFIGHRQVPFVLERYRKTVLGGKRVLTAMNCGRKQIAEFFGDGEADEIITRDSEDE